MIEPDWRYRNAYSAITKLENGKAYSPPSMAAVTSLSCEQLFQRPALADQHRLV